MSESGRVWRTAAELAWSAHVSVSMLENVLGELEAAGLVERAGGGWTVTGKFQREFGPAFEVAFPADALDREPGGVA